MKIKNKKNKNVLSKEQLRSIKIILAKLENGEAVPTSCEVQEELMKHLHVDVCKMARRVIEEGSSIHSIHTIIVQVFFHGAVVGTLGLLASKSSSTVSGN